MKSKSLLSVAIIMLLFAQPTYAFQFTNFGPLYDSQSWDYSPSWMADTVSGMDKIWWCSDRLNVGEPKWEGDVIKYRQGTSPAQVVLTPNGVGSWEGQCVCDPAVARGIFPYGGRSYQFIMYYTAAPNCAADNKIGVAFSNNGVNWIKYARNPIISTQFPGNGRYGAGAAQIHNWNGRSGIRIWYIDTPTNQPAIIYERLSNDGVNFGPPTPLSSTGLPTSVVMGRALAFTPRADFLYMVTRVPSTGNLNMYRIPTALRFGGTWSFVASIRPGGVLPSAIFEPGFRTDIYGNLSSTTYPGIWVGFGCGPLYLPENAPQWKLCQAGGR
jgi:hypothetical protein